MENILWLDLETTGLDPRNDLVLEIAMEVTSEFKPVAMFERVIHWDRWHIVNTDMSQIVLDMHTKNKLLAEVQAAPSHGEQVSKCQCMACVAVEAHSFVLKHFHDKAIIAGNSVHFDRRFLETKFRAMEELLHYRMIDVSSMREAVRIFKGTKIKKGDAHRAMADIHDAQEQLRKILDVL